MDKTKLGELLRIDQFAEMLNIRPSTVRAWLLRRRIAKVRISKRAVRIPATEAERLIQEGIVPTRDQGR
jgi:excisionase family DNA binding protein